MYNYNPYQFQYQKTEVVRVNGRNGAEAYQLAPNSSILLLDESSPIVWLKTTDGAGYPTLTPYKIEPFIEQNTSLQSLESRIARIEEMLNESNASNAEHKQ